MTITLATIAFGSLTMGYLACGMNLVEWGIMAVATLILFFPGIIHWATPMVDLPHLVVDGVWDHPVGRGLPDAESADPAEPEPDVAHPRTEEAEAEDFLISFYGKRK